APRRDWISDAAEACTGRCATDSDVKDAGNNSPQGTNARRTHGRDTRRARLRRRRNRSATRGTRRMSDAPSIGAVREYALSLQGQITARLEAIDARVRFIGEDTTTPDGGLSRPRVLEDGREIEKAAVQFSHSIGKALPPAATDRNPHLAGHPFQ